MCPSGAKGIEISSGVGFMAGLNIYERCGPQRPQPPHSAAYLIDGTGSTLMCYKVGPDDTVDRNYTPRRGKADFHNPYRYQGAWVGALICVDGNFSPRMAPFLGDRRDSIVDGSRVVCILAHMAKGNLGNGKSGSSVALTSGWDNKTLVLANSNPDGVDSFITNGAGIILEPTVGGARNKIVTLPLA